MRPLYFLLLLYFFNVQPVGGQTHDHVIPVLCYHNIRYSATYVNPDYTISPTLFREHLQMFKDSGYHSILPDELFQYLYSGGTVPPHPFVISFDDSRAEHFTVAAALLDSFGFKGVFFVMTVTIGKSGYLTKDQIHDLAARGHVIGCHTYDHPDLRKIGVSDWEIQLVKPKQLLERITGKPVDYFAYPFGAWNGAVVEQVRSAGFKAAFQLTGKASSTAPPFTLQRYMVPGNISAETLLKHLRPIHQ